MRPRRNHAARFSLLFALLGLAALPAAVAVTETRDDLRLLHAGVAVPVTLLFSALAVWFAKRARRGLERTLGRIGGARIAAAGRILGWIGIYIALTAAVSLGVYAYLEYVASD